MPEAARGPRPQSPSAIRKTPDPVACLRKYPQTFRKSLESDNRMCLSSFMAAEYDDLPGHVQHEVQAFADVNVAWLARMLMAGGILPATEAQARARSTLPSRAPSSWREDARTLPFSIP